jgi:hypothetical protein
MGHLWMRALNGCESRYMPNPAALVPVPFYAPVRTDPGNAGKFFNFSQSPGRITRAERQQRSVAPEVDAGLMYNHKGLCFGDARVGGIVNIWV